MSLKNKISEFFKSKYETGILHTIKTSSRNNRAIKKFTSKSR